MFERQSPLLVVLLIVASFAIGSMWTKIQYLEVGKTTKVADAKAANGDQNAPGAQRAAAPTQPPAPTSVKIPLTDKDSVLGDANAKVTIVEFSDYQCPFCEKFYTQTWPQIKKDYVDTGKAKFVYKNLAFLGAESTQAANASLCAKEQGKFWDYHDYLFKKQSGENQGTFSDTNLKQFAADLGLDTDKFNKCLDGKIYDSQVQDDMKIASSNGFNSTPSFAVNDKPLVGAVPYSQFQTLIDAALK